MLLLPQAAPTATATTVSPGSAGYNDSSTTDNPDHNWLRLLTVTATNIIATPAPAPVTPNSVWQQLLPHTHAYINNRHCDRHTSYNLHCPINTSRNPGRTFITTTTTPVTMTAMPAMTAAGAAAITAEPAPISAAPSNTKLHTQPHNYNDSGASCNCSRSSYNYIISNCTPQFH